MLLKEKQELILKALKAEKNLKYCNSGVIGGFDSFILSNLPKLALGEVKLHEYTHEFNKYTELTLQERHLLLKKLELEIKNKLNTKEEGIFSPKVIEIKNQKENVEEQSDKNQNMQLDNNIKQSDIEKSKQPTSEKVQINKKQIKSKEYSITESALNNIAEIGSKKISHLKRLGIENIEDILYYFPRRYEDRSQVRNISELVDGEVNTILATIKSVEVVTPRPRLKILKAILEDTTGVITAIWYNQTFLKNKLNKDKKIYLTGKVDMRFEKQIKVSDYTFFNESNNENPGIVPIYPAVEGISQKMITSIIKTTLNQYLTTIKEYLPPEILKEYHLMSIKEAIREIHFPSNWYLQNKARYRLVFEELLILQLGIKSLRKVTKNNTGISHVKKEKLTTYFLESLPYKLTDAQFKVIGDINKDMESTHSMNRLIQGDVGSGKTVVAIWALLKAIAGGYQGALMAPTEILAEQHYLSFLEILVPLGIIPVLLTGSMTKKEKSEKSLGILQGKYKLIIGTHALIQNEVVFDNLGIVVIDEQHRFGVNQRFELQKKGLSPDLLVMTATPIPRSLALTLYGDMELSVIDELPPGRQSVKTYHLDEKEIDRVYNFMRKEVTLGGQVYIVCPLVEESEKLDLENATNLAEYLSKDVFPELNVGLIHGRLKVSEKENVMQKFRAGEINILVATTVIEVGVNVPNATVMMIKNAERFGLAQLHQLRGRVGRSSKKSYCILISNLKSKESRARMEIMTSSTDGFIIAEQDLNLRGPGDFFGTRQHGLPSLKIADIIKDHTIMEVTKDLAMRILTEDAESSKYNLLMRHVYRKFKTTTI
ncbi:ATP-dependent DNA helicase RecG [Desulfonispora thiosulfatigenes DSM 11270]|uniref:ATP-dependent DNA helicase RecG n=1 Tax=Desulfonispora thiosulfatigenes DSM 11270 TaxID=656914 RepID=A0A1W1VJI1_DESTI|nr:ATP-dependent DNA helicase RecG [Desulfonispora thiosulfatigenes]SMB93535.1 ATP-dependent DNA helicase RecG [Desulfonispora thiosulfatigenes DSM 11270]